MTSVELVPATYADVVFIARRLREDDYAEIMPLTWTRKPEDLAVMSLADGGISTVALSGGAPVSSYGAVEIRPKFWTVWMFATDRWPEVALKVTRAIKKDLIPDVYKRGWNRAECWSVEDHHTAHAWLEVLGAIRECSAEDYGPNGKTYHCYSWTRSRFERQGGSFYVS